jgi:3'(2'), 5'-bisphosphate nucleotidase
MPSTERRAASTDHPPATDAGFARWLAGRAGDLLVGLRADLGFADADALRAAGDLRSNELIQAELARWRAGDAVLSEESPDVALRLSAERVWIVDPLDGTREFGEPDRVDWAVHIGLWQRVGPAADSRGRLVAGAVALPAQHRILGTDVPPPPVPPADGRRPIRVAVSRTRPPALLAGLVEDLHAQPVPLGSAGAKIAAVVTGEVDAYVHAGGQYEWDSAAPVAVAIATGLHASRIDGTGLEYNQVNPWLPDLVVCRKDLASRLVAALRRYGG